MGYIQKHRGREIEMGYGKSSELRGDWAHGEVVQGKVELLEMKQAEKGAIRTQRATKPAVAEV